MHFELSHSLVLVWYDHCDIHSHNTQSFVLKPKNTLSLCASQFNWQHRWHTFYGDHGTRVPDVFSKCFGAENVMSVLCYDTLTLMFWYSEFRGLVCFLFGIPLSLHPPPCACTIATSVALVGSVLGSIGKPILESRPALKAFEGLLGVI